MKYTYIFPSILIALDVLSAIAYGFSRDWRQVIYWLAAATLSACVTYRKEEHDVNTGAHSHHRRGRLLPLHLLPPRHVSVTCGEGAGATLLHPRGRGNTSRPGRPLCAWRHHRRMRGVLPRQGRGTPRADAVGRPLATLARGLRPILGELRLSVHGRRVVLFRRRRLDARRGAAGVT